MSTPISGAVALSLVAIFESCDSIPDRVEVWLGCWALSEGSPYPKDAVGGIRALGRAVAEGRDLVGHPWSIPPGLPMSRANIGTRLMEECKRAVYGPSEPEVEAVRPSSPAPADPPSSEVAGSPSDTPETP